MTRMKLSDIHAWKSPLITGGNLTDLMNRHFDIFDDLFNEATTFSSKLNLPYNTILIDDENYRIELALAGYAKEDISVFVENDGLYIETLFDGEEVAEKPATTSVEKHDTSSLNISSYPHYIHKGISKKYFKLRFGVPKNYKSFAAKMENGLLIVDIKTEIPKPKRQSINID